jgi:hypothetical protein
MGTRRKIRIIHIGAGACTIGRQSRSSHAVPRLWRNQHGVSSPEVDEGRRDCLLWSVAARQLGRPGLNSCAEKNAGVGGTVSPSWTCLWPAQPRWQWYENKVRSDWERSRGLNPDGYAVSWSALPCCNALSFEACRVGCTCDIPRCVAIAGMLARGLTLCSHSYQCWLLLALHTSS